MLFINKEFSSKIMKKSRLRNNSLLKGATKLQRKIIFVSATKIGENTTNILNC